MGLLTEFYGNYAVAILWFPLVEPFSLITFLQSVIFLVFVCLLLMDFFFFWPGVFTSCLGGAIPC